MPRRTLLAFAVGIFACVPTLAQGFGTTQIDPEALPQQAQARLNEQGNIVVKRLVACMVCEAKVREVTKPVVVEVDGKKITNTVVEQQTYTVCRPVFQTIEFLVAAEQAKFFDMNGKPVGMEKVAAALKSETTILFANRDAPTYYLTVFKPDTLYLKLDAPQMCAPAAPAGVFAAPPAPAPAPPPAPAPAPAAIPKPAPARPAPAPVAAPAPAPPVEAAPAPSVGPAPAIGSSTPARMSPRVSLAKGGKDTLALRVYLKDIGSETVLQTVDLGGVKKEVPASVETESIIDVEKRFPWKVVKVYRTDGQEVAASEFPKLFAASRGVLVSADGQKVDPSQLKIVKPDTLIVVHPIPVPPAAPMAVSAPVAFPAPAPPAPAPVETVPSTP